MANPSATLRWIVSPVETAMSCDVYMDRVDTRLFEELSVIAKEIEETAKAYHPWSNVTGAAEAGLNCHAERSGTGVKVILAHGVDYGIWLEVKFGGKWGVIEPAMTLSYPDIMAAMMRALEG